MKLRQSTWWVCMLMFALPFSVDAQTIGTDNNLAIIHTDQSVFEEYSIVHITNYTNDTLTLRWTRTIDSLQNGWETSICDNGACYGSATATATFTLEPGLACVFKYSLFPNNISGSGGAHVVLEAVGRPDIPPITIEYLFFVNGTATPVSQLNQNPQLINIASSNGELSATISSSCSRITSYLVGMDGKILENHTYNNLLSGELIKFVDKKVKTGYYVLYLTIETDPDSRINKAYNLLLTD